MNSILSRGLVDVHRRFEPENADLFTWWAPWRNMKQRNIGWRLDYVFAAQTLADRATSCVVQREVGTSDHGPVIATFTVTRAATRETPARLAEDDPAITGRLF
jgi:exodeoxyribonuclease-3